MDFLRFDERAITIESSVRIICTASGCARYQAPVRKNEQFKPKVIVKLNESDLAVYFVERVPTMPNCPYSFHDRWKYVVQ